MKSTFAAPAATITLSGAQGRSRAEGVGRAGPPDAAVTIPSS